MFGQKQRLTIEAFDEFVKRPENADRLFELIGGEVVEVPSNPFASEIAGRIFGELYIFLKGKNLGHLTGEAGGYMVSGERYAPDVAFISNTKQRQLAQSGYNPNPPDLAVEVDFPSTQQSQENLAIKIGNYLAAGTALWLVRPEHKQVVVYMPAQPVKILGLGDELDGGSVLPNFKMAVNTIFAE